MPPELPCDSVAPKSPEPRHWFARAVSACTWLYVAAVLAVWLLLWVGGDRWWFATLMLFGPRWLYGLPLLVLAPAAMLTRRRLLWALGAATVVVVGPLMGFCVPWARLAVPSGPSLRVLTCNVKGKCHNNEALDNLINATLPDIVALQGCWGELQVDSLAGWHVWKEGSLVVASRFPLRHEGKDHVWRRPGHWPRTDVLRCAIQTPEREIDVCSVHLMSPHEGIDAVIDRETVVRPSDGPILDAAIEQRWHESENTAEWVSQLPDSFILAGDFNMPTDSRIYRRYWAERRNAFSQAGLGFGYTEWPRVCGFSWGARIDQVLTGTNWRCRSCWVGPDIGSDHLPLVADLVWDPDDGQP